MPILLSQETIDNLKDKIAGLIQFMSDKVLDPEPYYLHIEEGYQETFRVSSYSKDNHEIQDSDIPIIDLVDFNNFLMDRNQPEYVPDKEAIHEAVISFLESYISSKH